jgi:acyl carrier protein
MSKSALEVMQRLLKDRLDIDEEKVTTDTLLLDLGIDSLMQIELLFDFEDKYKVKIPDRSVRPTTIGELVRIIQPFLPKDL